MRFLVSALALGVLCTAAAAGNPQVEAIHEQIKLLKAEEKVTVKEIHDWYGSIIKRDKWDEKVVAEEQKILKKQEDALTAVAQDKAARKAIHEQYDALRGLLRVGGKLDAETAKKLKALEKAHEKYVSEAYKGKIALLEEEAKLAAKKK
jgi:hypothetical protein